MYETRVGQTNAAEKALGLLRTLSLALVVLPFVPPSTVRGHGDLHDQIQSVTEAIERDPENAQLYFNRGELHRFHGEWARAIEDFSTAEKLDPKLTLVDLARGRAYLQAGQPDDAIRCIDRFLAQEPDNAEAHADRASALVQLKDLRAAADAFERAIALAKDVEPGLYIDRAKALFALGPDHVDAALDCIAQGQQRLGRLITLDEVALDFECDSGRYDDALRRIDHILGRQQRTETWLYRRGEILEKAQRPQDARESYHAALLAIEQLSESQRKVNAMTRLEQSVHRKLELLAVKENREGKDQ